jgi:hypothetical protein
MEHHLTPDLIAALSRPFPVSEVDIKPGAVRQDETAALALAYADWRAYAERLDAVVGPAGWSIQLIPWGNTRVIARLTLFGVTKDASGEGDPDDPHAGTIAEAQAKKRACADFGLGRYLYHLPRIWGEGQGDRKNFRFHDPRRIVERMYAEAGLLQHPPASHPPVIRPVSTITGVQPPPHGMAADHGRLGAADTGQQPLISEEATLKQRNAILVRIGRVAEDGIDPDDVDRLGSHVGINRLSRLRKIAHIPTNLTKQSASFLIGELDKLINVAHA